MEDNTLLPASMVSVQVGPVIMSPTIGKITLALSKAQAKFTHAIKDNIARVEHRSGGSHSYKYSTLADVFNVVREPFAEQEIAVMQPHSVEGNKVTVATMLLHGGEFIMSPLTASATDTLPQSIGSTLTYLRRYGLSALAGVATDDDDGATGQGRAPEAHPAQRSTPRPTAPVNTPPRLANGQNAPEPVPGTPAPAPNGNGVFRPAVATQLGGIRRNIERLKIEPDELMPIVRSVLRSDLPDDREIGWDAQRIIPTGLDVDEALALINILKTR